MHRVRTLLAVTALVLALVGVPGLAAGASATPGNDGPTGAKVIGSLPYSVQQNTTGATTSDLERKLAVSCGVETVRKGVWFKFTPGGNFTLRLSAANSTYSVGMMVTTGAPSNTKGMTCSDRPIFRDVTKGATYWILAFAAKPGSTGGTLRLAATKAPALPTVTLAVTRGVAKPATGAARIFGTATCKGPGSQLEYLAVEVTQNPGTPKEAHGFGWLNMAAPSSNTPINWQVDVLAQSSSGPGEPAITNPFEPGPATVNVVATARTADGRTQDAFTSAVLTLTKP